MENFKLIPELKVSNFQKSLDFYTNLAGFTVLYDRPEEEFVMIKLGDAEIMIESISSKSRHFEVGTLEYPFGRGIHFQIQVQDVEGVYKNFKDHRYPIFLEMEDKWYRKGVEKIHHRQFLVQDPDGYLLRFFGNLS